MDYVNTDSIIEEKTGITINKIFGEKGEKYFREVEKTVVKEVSGMNNSVIDAGGGVVINEDNLNNLRINGLLFCLNADPEEIYKRIKNHTHRPLLNVSDPLRKIKEILKKRGPYYRKAEYQIDTNNRSAQDVAREIAGIYEKAFSKHDKFTG